MFSKLKIITLFAFFIIFAFACNESGNAETNPEKINLNKKLHYTISELDDVMNHLRGDILQSQIDSNYQKLEYLNKLEAHRHILTMNLNKLKFISVDLWNDYENKVKIELSEAKETLKKSEYFE